MKKLANAVFDMPPTSDYYEFLKRETEEDPVKMIKGGASSDEYAARFSKTFAMVCETPVVGNICYTGGIGACSVEPFKKDIEPIENALEAVDRLDGVTYSWRSDEFLSEALMTAARSV